MNKIKEDWNQFCHKLGEDPLSEYSCVRKPHNFAGRHDLFSASRYCSLTRFLLDPGWIGSSAANMADDTRIQTRITLPK